MQFVRGDTLDLGAGTQKYRSMIEPNTKSYIAMDIIAAPGIAVVGDIHATPFTDNSFDTIISTQILEHVRKPWLVAIEMYRIARPGGHIIVTAPFMVGYHPDPEDNFRFTKDGLALLFREAGFTIKDYGFYGSMGGVFSEAVHFTWFNPYTKKHSKFGAKMMSYFERFIRKIDHWFPRRAVFANSFVIAIKPDIK